MQPNPVLRSDSALALSMEQRAHEGAAQPVTLLVRLPAGWDEPALRRAHATVLDRLPAARLVFGEVAGFHGLRQASGAAPEGSWRTYEADMADPDARPQAYAAWQADLALALRSGRHAGLHAAWFDAPEGGWLALGASPLVADGGSLHALAESLLGTARGLATGDDEPFDYLNYVLWRQDIEADDAAPAQAYWAAHATATAAVPRLALRRDEAGADEESPAIQVALDEALARAVDAVAARLARSHEEVLHAAWLALLGRLQGDGPLVSGWQHDCRDDYEMLVGAVGAYEKRLPLHLSWSGEQSFEDWTRALADLRTTHREVQEHWQGCGQAAHTAFGFASRRAGTGFEGVTVADAPLPTAFELGLSAIGDAAGRPVQLWLNAWPGAYEAAALRTLAAHYRDVLTALGADPRLPLARVLEPAEPACLQGPALDVGADSLYERIAQWARDTPRAPAVVDVEQGITLDYATLFERVESLAGALQARGVRAGTVVALHLPRSATLVAAMLAAWRCGAAYLPLDPAWPAARIETILRDANAAAVVAPPAGTLRYPVPAVTPETDATQAQAAAFDPESARGGHAYILYTSGSTGTPKGVPVGQRQLLNYVVAASQAMALGRWRRWAMTATIAADLGNTAVYAALLHGAALVIAPEPALHDAKAYARFVRQQGIDAVKMVPSHLAALLEDEASAVPACVVLGGEATSGALLRRIVALAPACEIHNHYGPTETTVGVLVHRVAGPDDTRGGIVPLSQPLANCRVYLLDGEGRPAPVGALGELHVGGAQVVEGYLGQPEHRAFVADPRVPGQRCYRTGDLAYLLPGGRLRLAGRVDHQLKVRGFRVEPAEIEAALLAQPGVLQAVVLAHDVAQSVQLVAFVAARVEPAELEARRESLLRALAEALPEPMVPARIVFLPVLPRLANGKIDRLALAPQLDQAAEPLDLPRDALEAVIADSVATLLQRDRIGVHDDFFELGGHSLLVIKLVTRLRKQLREEVEPGLVFDHPTVARLAAALRAQAADAAALDEVAAARMQLAALAPQERAALVATLSESA